MTTTAARPDLLFLCHRIPYPPDKGDKIRSYHWLRALAEAFRLHLVAFVDDPADWVHRDKLEQLCASCSLFALHPLAAKVRSLWGLVTGEPLTLPYYRNAGVKSALQRLVGSTQITHVFVYSSAMAQYALTSDLGGTRRVIDFVDVDSDKWRQYAERMRGVARWIYEREARKLEAFDFNAAHACDLSLLVSAAEAAWFSNRLGHDSQAVTYVTNGVDTEYFDPELDLDSPFEAGIWPVVFTGAMDYWANVDAVVWFVREVWPLVQSEQPNCKFYIVGSRPTPEVHALASNSVAVTGRVRDVRPYLKHAAAVVAPMRIARGIQNKVLEGMAMARPLVVTPKALEGIDAEPGSEVLVGQDRVDFAKALLQAFAATELGVAARLKVKRDYGWGKSCDLLRCVVLGQMSAGGSRMAMETAEDSSSRQLPEVPGDISVRRPDYQPRCT